MSKKVRVKPGKTQSMMGFIVGILFCLIGAFAVIPAAGIFGVFWTLMALIITITNGINAFTDKGVASHEIVIDEEKQAESQSHQGGIAGMPSDMSNTVSDMSDTAIKSLKGNIELRLQVAEDLYKAGTITKEEYEAKRREILDEL